MNAPVRFRIKGTTQYIDPTAASLSRAFRMETASVYQTVGSGQRSLRWRAPSVGPNVAVESGLTTLRNQSRELVRKNPMAASAVERIVSNTVGTGIKPKLSEQTVLDTWTAWTDEADAAGVQDFYGVQAQAMASVVTAGEVFVRLRVRRAVDNLTVPLQLELLESEFVPLNKNEKLNNGNVVRHGIEFDANLKSKRVAYWMYPYHPDDMVPGVGENEPVRVPASEVLHLFLPSRPGQVRGEPWMARVLALLKDVAAYDQAELTRKKISALFVGFIRRPTPEGLSLDDLEELYGDDAAINNGAGDIGMEPGSMNVLAPGEEVEFSDPKDTGSQYEAFMRSQYRSIAAALGLLYEQLTGDYSQVNDRTWRAAVQEFRRRCENWQHHLLVFQFCRPVFTRWAALASLGGLKTLVPEWTPPRWPYINPEQDINAIEKEIQAGLTSRKRAVSERGDDAERIDAEQSEDNKRADTLELRYTSDGRVAEPDPIKLEQKKAEFAPTPVVSAPPRADLGMEILAALAMREQSQPTLVLPERVTVDAVKAMGTTYTEIEMKDEQGRIKSLLVKPVSGVGPTIRRTALHDENGRLIGCQEEVIDG